MLRREASTTHFVCLCMVFYRYIPTIGFYASQFWNLAIAFFDFYKCELFFLKVEKGYSENLRICCAEKPRRHTLCVSVWYSTDTFLQSASMLRNSGTSLPPFLTFTRNKARFPAEVPFLFSPKIFRRKYLHTGEVKKKCAAGVLALCSIEADRKACILVLTTEQTQFAARLLGGIKPGFSAEAFF